MVYKSVPETGSKCDSKSSQFVNTISEDGEIEVQPFRDSCDASLDSGSGEIEVLVPEPPARPESINEIK